MPCAAGKGDKRDLEVRRKERVFCTEVEREEVMFWHEAYSNHLLGHGSGVSSLEVGIVPEIRMRWSFSRTESMKQCLTLKSSSPKTCSPLPRNVSFCYRSLAEEALSTAELQPRHAWHTASGNTLVHRFASCEICCRTRGQSDACIRVLV